MKNFKITFLIIIFIQINYLVSANDSLAWQKIGKNIPGFDNFTDMYLSGKTIAISGMLGIYVSDDIGTNFRASTTSNIKYAISLADSNTILCVGSNGMAAFSSDAGINWEEKKIGTDKRFKAIAFPSTTTAYAAGESMGDTNGYFYKYTYNSNPHWNKINIKNMVVTIESIYFINDSCGYICGNGNFIWHTTDGAKSWIKDDIPEINKCLYDIFFINENIGWAVGSGGDILHWNGSEWKKQISPANADLHSVFFLTDQTGWAVGGNGIILNTTDGGKNWNRQASGLTTSCLNAVFAIHKDLVFACGNNHELLCYKLYTCNTENTSKENISVYFANDAIHLDIGSYIVRNFNLYDIFGRNLVNLANSNQTFIDTRKYASGLYLWSANIEGKNYFGKILIE